MAGGFGAAPNSLGFGGPAALLAPRLLKTNILVDSGVSEAPRLVGIPAALYQVAATSPENTGSLLAGRH